MSVVNTVKDVISVVQKADNIDLYKKLLDVYKECMDLDDENRMLKERIKELEEEKMTNDKLELKGHCYYIKKEDEQKDGPFCTTCWDKDRKLIRMHIINVESSDYASCHVCRFATHDVE